MALRTGAPVVLVGVGGADRVIRPGTWKPVLSLRRHRIEVSVSPPVDLAVLLGLPPGPLAVVSDEIAAAAVAVLQELLTGQVRLALGEVGDRASAAVAVAAQPRDNPADTT